MDRHRPFVVPGFGCSYWEQSASLSPSSDLELCFVHRDDPHPNLPALFRGSENVVTVLTTLEAGRGKLSWPSGPSFDVDAREWGGFVNPASAFTGVPHQRNRGRAPDLGNPKTSSKVFLLKLLVLRFHEPAFVQVEKEFGITKSDFLAAFVPGQALPKSFWIEEVLHRMIFERLLARRTDSLSSHFCETELLKEVFYSWAKLRQDQAVTQPRKARTPTSSTEDLTLWTTAHATPQMQRALRFVEENLHRELDVDTIARAATVSSSTLLRLFKQHLGTTPLKHVWRRRLQEARLLLLSGGYTVLEVAHHAGFSSGAAFTKAFVSEFGETPRPAETTSQGTHESP
jgi:AraC-like DNA-binding protein